MKKDQPVLPVQRFQRLVEVLNCPACGRSEFRFDPAGPCQTMAWEPAGTVNCLRCSMVFPIEEGVLNMLPHGTAGLTLAQWSGQTRAVSWLYERIWRKNALTLLTGEDFPPAREYEMLRQGLKPALQLAGGVFVDLGCSTGYYGRGVAAAMAQAGLLTSPSCIVGVDISRRMLSQAREFARRSGTLGHTFFVLADAAHLPLCDHSVAALVCGGSLNEYRDPGRVLAEGARVLWLEQGRYFVMNLLEPTDAWARLTRKTMTFGSGLKFFTRPQLDAMFARAGLTKLHGMDFGMVAFSELSVTPK
ncbi:MAG: methyltransferase domain-containing protein [Blastocatellia bacterium]|nr:methyltransferase domain-containing protein [Blastocatellia bacterium]